MSGTGRGNYNFGLYQNTNISGAVFNDNGAGGGIANNGIRDGAEAGIVRRSTRTARRRYGTPFVARALTDGTGAYSLSRFRAR